MAGMADFDVTFWQERYRSSEAVWSGRPNPSLVAEVAELSPGRALDAGSGEGADAIWLAEQGWRVTALEWSSVAIERAAGFAGRAGVAERIDWQQVDLAGWVPGDYFDLVSAQYLHLPPPIRGQVFQRLAEAVAPAGSLLLVGHHPSDLRSGVHRPEREELYFTADELIAQLPAERWRIVTNELREREHAGADGPSHVVRDTVVRAVRIS
jgi:SAM-dependent methyltransferase